jgi:uncharacterized cupredoxin-like copper-binding protein
VNWTRCRHAALGALLVIGFVGCGGGGGDESESETQEARTVEITATEYTFEGESGEGIVAGETIRFLVSNAGELTHEMQVLDGDGRLIDRTGEIPPGGQDEVTVNFVEAGVYQVICDIDDHLSRGQQVRFPVDEG